MLDGGAATVKELELRDGVVDVDVFTPASRGFFGIQFRVANDGANGEWVYLRQHKSGAQDAMQYTPVLNTGLNWQLYTGPGFTGAVDVPKNERFHLRLELSGAQAKLFVKDMDKPALVMPDLKSGNQKGQVALAVLTGATCFLGIMDVESDAIYLPLKKGRNELLLAVSELGGGWGFIARLD
ncbi:MAG: hypothetical protein V4858_22875 [Pseudomonadota bacterium]